MLRGVLDKAAASAGIARGTKDHEALAVQLLQLANVIREESQLVEALRQGARWRGLAHRRVAADASRGSTAA